jgi:hypothetical protein
LATAAVMNCSRNVRGAAAFAGFAGRLSPSAGCGLHDDEDSLTRTDRARLI